MVIAIFISAIKSASHSEKIKQASTKQIALYKDNLIPTLMGDFKDYKIENLSCNEIDSEGQCDYAIEIDCNLYIGQDKFNYPLIVLFNNNNEDNPKYQYSKEATDAINDNISKKQKAAEPVVITSKNLYKAYEANEVDADKKYSKRIGIVTGKIRKISVTSGDPVISLSNGDSGSLLGVNCYFSDNNQSSKIAKLKKGSTITIKGTIRGMSMVDVCLDDCEIQ
jgi:hypothetical protein